MAQEDKELLLKDLSARLPYGVKFKAEDEECIRVIHYIKDEEVYIREYRNLPYWIDDIKPYLRPMSSITEEEKEKYDDMFYKDEEGAFICDNADWFDFMNSHHFDYRGLIEKNLALEAPEGMYNINNK